MSVGKTYILCCPTLKRELLAALGEEEDKVTNKKATATVRAGELSTPTVIYLPAGLHSDPKKLQRYVQEQIDELTDAYHSLSIRLWWRYYRIEMTRGNVCGRGM